MTLKANAQRMRDAVTFVSANPGTTMRAVILHVLSTFDAAKREKAETDSAAGSRLYKQAASVVERIIKDRHVCQGSNQSLHPWDPKRKAYAEALERAKNAAPEGPDRVLLTEMTYRAWLAAGDENRVRTLQLLDGVSPPSHYGVP